MGAPPGAMDVSRGPAGRNDVRWLYCIRAGSRPQGRSAAFVPLQQERTLTGAGLTLADGGASWAPSYSSTIHPGVTALAVDPVTPSTLYAGAVREEYDPKFKVYYYFAALYKSSNAGGTWTLSSIGIRENDNYIHAVAIDPVSPAMVYAATALGLYKSTK